MKGVLKSVRRVLGYRVGQAGKDVKIVVCSVLCDQIRQKWQNQSLHVKKAVALDVHRYPLTTRTCTATLGMSFSGNKFNTMIRSAMSTEFMPKFRSIPTYHLRFLGLLDAATYQS